jgi:hypothetical protein
MIDKAAGVIYGPFEHHLDHLAAFCSLMGVPLVVTEEDLRQKALLYYPDLEVLHWDSLETPFEVVKSFDIVFYSTPRILFDEVFFIAEATLKKKIRTVWLPHGNSDKGHASYFMEGLKDEKTLLVYGQKMIDFISQKLIQTPHCIPIGNYRLAYYRRHKHFYDAWMEKLKLPSKFILYAPTWQDEENSSSFFDVAQFLIEEFPADEFLVIKLHPNLEKEIGVQQLILQNEHRSNVCFLTGFTPVYPILERSTAYLGDMSSVGYDFLSFNRPMFFYNPAKREASDPGLYLHRCGHTLGLTQTSQTFRRMRQEGDQSHLTQLRQETYTYTFGEDRPWSLIRELIRNDMLNIR